MRKLLSFFLLVVFFSVSITSVNAISPLHADGPYIKNETDHIVFLRGVNRGEYNNYWTGAWECEGEGWGGGGNLYFREDCIRWQMDILKNQWGINIIRWTLNAQWWIDNQGYTGPNTGYRYWLRRAIEIADEYGIYIMFTPWRMNPEDGGAQCPCPIGDNSQGCGSFTIQEFADFWKEMIQYLDGLPNVIVEPWNEPHMCPDMEITWQLTVQEVIDSIRSTDLVYQPLILYQWGYGTGPNMRIVDWYNSYPVTGANIVISTHIYGNAENYRWQNQDDYDALKSQMETAQIKDVADVLNKPLLVGETNGKSGEMQFFENLLSILNEWDIGYQAWVLRPPPSALGYDLIQDQPYFPPPTTSGQILIDTIAAGSGVTTTTTITTTTSVPTTSTIPPGQVVISGQLKNATGTIEADVIVYNQGTDGINTSTKTSGGDHTLNVWPDVYDLQYEILELFIPNFFIKLISLDVFSDLQDVVNYVNGYHSENKVSFNLNITTDQEIQVYSEQEPKTVKANGIKMTKGTLPLSANEWFYNSTEQRLYFIVGPVLPTTTTTTTIFTTTSSTTITSTTTPGMIQVTDCDSTTDFITANVQVFETDNDRQQGSASVKATGGTSGSYIMYIYYNPSGTWNWANTPKLRFWMKLEDYDIGLIDLKARTGVNDYVLFDIAGQFSQNDTWTEIEIDLNNPDSETGTFDISSVDSIVWEYQQKNNGYFMKIDDVRVGAS